MADTILVPIDGSDDARQAATHAVRMADERGATLHVLEVVDRQVMAEPGLSTAELRTVEAEDRGHSHVREVIQMAEAAGVEAIGEVCHGVPHETIIEYGETIDADAIVLGEHGEHDVHLGGVRRKITSQCDREVIVVEGTNGRRARPA